MSYISYRNILISEIYVENAGKRSRKELDGKDKIEDRVDAVPLLITYIIYCYSEWWAKGF